jgi:2-dehydropantoate 2-reductase
MRFVMYGAGAIGGVVGGRLHQHGHDVVLIARGEHGAAIRRDGLRLESADGSVFLPMPVVEHASELAFGDGDVVMLATKSQDSIGAVETLARLAPVSMPVVSLQNGVENERVALRRFTNVYGVCVMCPATHLEPGVVQASSSPITGLFDIGRYPIGLDDTAVAIAGALSSSTFESIPRPDIMRWKYSKLLMNLGNAAEALSGPDARLSDVARDARKEGAAVLRAAAIDFASREEDAERRGDLLQIAPVAGRERGGGSTWQSLRRGARTIESDYLNGEIVLLGRLHGVPTPVNEALQRLANRAAHDRLAPGSLPLDELAARVAAGA